MGDRPEHDSRQLELPFAPPAAERPVPHLAAKPAAARPGLRVIQGGGERKHEPLKSRDAVVRVLVESGADMLLRRISVERAEEIQAQVDSILELFDKVDRERALMPVLTRALDELEGLMRETRARRSIRQNR